MCRGPGDLGGNPVGDLRYSDLCDGQWASMLSLAPRLPKNKISLDDVKSPFEYLQENFTNATVLRIVYAEAAAAAAAASAAGAVETLRSSTTTMSSMDGPLPRSIMPASSYGRKKDHRDRKSSDDSDE